MQLNLYPKAYDYREVINWDIKAATRNIETNEKFSPLNMLLV